MVSIGFTPITAPTLEPARAVLQVMTLERAIVDDAAGTLKALRILKRAWHDEECVPVMVASQSFDADSRREAMELGTAGYLHRPAFQDNVARVLLASLRSRRQSLVRTQPKL